MKEKLYAPSLIAFNEYLDKLVDDDETLEKLYDEDFELSFHGMTVKIPWGAPSYNALTDALKQIHDDMDV